MKTAKLYAPHWARGFDKKNFTETLKYALYVMIHPFDGFWDLTHEKRGSLAAANILTAAMVLLEILRETLTNFQFISVNMQKFNVIVSMLRVLLPLLLWTAANWSFTTLMDGKGKLFDIYMATAYALTPYIIINTALIPLTWLLTFNEGAVYYVLRSFSALWSGLLILAGMMQIHDYTPSKTILSCILTIVGMGIIIFIFVVFFSLVSDGVAYFVSLYKEFLFRVL
jgi:hypothetical protein